jgi:hypothetical protein
LDTIFGVQFFISKYSKEVKEKVISFLKKN